MAHVPSRNLDARSRFSFVHGLPRCFFYAFRHLSWLGGLLLLGLSSPLRSPSIWCELTPPAPCHAPCSLACPPHARLCSSRVSPPAGSPGVLLSSGPCGGRVCLRPAAPSCSRFPVLSLLTGVRTILLFSADLFLLLLSLQSPSYVSTCGPLPPWLLVLRPLCHLDPVAPTPFVPLLHRFVQCHSTFVQPRPHWRSR